MIEALILAVSDGERRWRLVRVPIGLMAKIIGRSEATLRAWLGEEPCPLSVEIGPHRGGRKGIPGRVRYLDADEVRALHEARGGKAWRPEWLPTTLDADALAAEVSAQAKRIQMLEALVRELRSEVTELRGRRATQETVARPANWPVPAPAQAPAATGEEHAAQGIPETDVAMTWRDHDIRGSLGGLPLPSARESVLPDELPSPHVPLHDPQPRPRARVRYQASDQDSRRTAAWARGKRSSPVYSAFWREDVKQAANGLLLFQTWGKMCGVKSEILESHVKRQREGDLPRGLSLDFVRVDVSTRGEPLLLRYVNSVQRGAWLRYWQQLGRAVHAPTEEAVEDALDELMSWVTAVAATHSAR